MGRGRLNAYDLVLRLTVGALEPWAAVSAMAGNDRADFVSAKADSKEDEACEKRATSLAISTSLRLQPVP